MVSIAIRGFQGQAPRLDRHALANEQSAGCTNVELSTGKIVPLRRPVTDVPAATTTGVYLSSGSRTAAKRLFRLLTSAGAVQYWLSNDVNASLLRSPVSNDGSDRVYWTEAGTVPMMSTMSRLASNSTPYHLGLPVPPTLSVSVTGGAPPNITRTYVCTYLTTYGEEGPPSDPITVTGPADGTWAITGYPTTNPDANRPITAIRFYRSELTTGVLRYLSSQTFTAPASFNDNIGETTLALRVQLPSVGWSAPPSTLQGIVAHPNGFFAGFTGRDVYFSEPYLPHAWPPGYSLRVQHPIVALAVMGDAIAVLTKGQPVILTGITPLSMTPEVMGIPSPCIAPRSVVVDNGTVYYATTDGLAQLDLGGVRVVSEPYVDRQEWIANWYNAAIRAVIWNGYYMALTSVSRGFLFSPRPPAAGFIQLALPNDRQGIDVAPDNGETYLLYNGNIERWQPADAASSPLIWSWTSKTFLTPEPVNFGAVQVKLPQENYGTPPEATPEQDAMLEYNSARLQNGPLDVFNLYAFGEEAELGVAPLASVPMPPQQPLGGEPLYEPFRSLNVILRVFCRDTLVWEDEVIGEHTRKLPARIKGSRWYFELSGNRPVLALHVAETGKELARV